MTAEEAVLDELRRSLEMCEAAAVEHVPGDKLGQLAFQAGWLKRTIERAIETLETATRRGRGRAA